MDRRLAWLSGSALILLLSSPTTAFAQGAWCARLTGGGENCGFGTYEQCRATVNGVGGTCVPNPRGRGVRLPGMPGLPGMLPGMRGMPWAEKDAEEPKNGRRYEERRRELGEKQRRQYEYERERRRIEEEKERREAEQKRANRAAAGTPAKDISTVKNPPAAPSREPAAPVAATKPTQTAPPPKPAVTPGAPTDTAPATAAKQPAPAPRAPDAAVTSPAPAVPAPVAATKPTDAATTPENAEPKPTVRIPDPADTTPASAAPATAATIAAAPPVPPATPPNTEVNIWDLDTNAAPSLSSEDIRRVQTALNGRGFDPGPINGVLNPQTQQALQKFQTTYGINTRGVVDSQTLFALGEAELASRR